MLGQLAAVASIPSSSVVLPLPDGPNLHLPPDGHPEAVGCDIVDERLAGAGGSTCRE